jgi:anti-sigma factor RsiW
MECLEMKELLSASIDGEVSQAEARRIEAHLEGCAECRALERKMRAIGTGVAMTEGIVPSDFREKLFARMEAEDLLPRRRSLFVFSIRWAAVPLAAAALALFLLTSPEKGKDSVSPRVQLPHVARRAPATESGEAPASAGFPRVAAQGRPAVPVPGHEQLTPEDREIVAHLDVLEDPSALDAPGDDDDLEILAPPGRRQG